jgi:hypothetical protein
MNSTLLVGVILFVVVNASAAFADSDKEEPPQQYKVNVQTYMNGHLLSNATVVTVAKELAKLGQSQLGKETESFMNHSLVVDEKDQVIHFDIDFERKTSGNIFKVSTDLDLENNKAVELDLTDDMSLINNSYYKLIIRVERLPKLKV